MEYFVQKISEKETPYGIKIMIETLNGEKFYIRPHNCLRWLEGKKLNIEELSATTKDGKVIRYKYISGLSP